MKMRIKTAVATLLCVVTLLSAGIAPTMACVPLSGEGDAIVYSEEVRWYYRTNHGVEEMRLWSVTQGRWLTDWIPVPDEWLNP